jgi:hypothetical protein
MSRSVNPRHVLEPTDCLSGWTEAWFGMKKPVSMDASINNLWAEQKIRVFAFPTGDQQRRD